jgi:hypothetical protein
MSCSTCARRSPIALPPGRICKTQPLLEPGPSSSFASIGGEAAFDNLVDLLPSSSPLDAPEAVDANQPTLIHNAAARGWSWSGLLKTLRGHRLDEAALTRPPHHQYLPADPKSAMHKRGLRCEHQHIVRNSSAKRILARLHANKSRLVWFGEVPPPLKPLLEEDANERFFATEWDAKQSLQYAWLSSEGMRTHTHFDNDRNFFVQLLGEKRFVLWPPNMTRHLCPYPRLHPLWHKSRAAFEAPPDPQHGLRACSNYSKASGLRLTVVPGDVLYIPPFWWHTVETIGGPSLSLSSLSRWPQLYNHLNAMYTHEYFFDALLHHRSRAFGLRAFLAQLLLKAKMPNLLDRLLLQYDGLHGRELASDDNQSSWSCAIDQRGTPTCRWCLSRINLDVTLVWDEHLTKLPADVREVVMPEYIEELTAEALGVGAVLPFWRDCLGPTAPGFFLTKGQTTEHKYLWQTR